MMRFLTLSLVLGGVIVMMLSACSNSKHTQETSETQNISNQVEPAVAQKDTVTDGKVMDDDKQKIDINENLKPAQGFWKCNDRSEYRIEIENETFVQLFLNRENFKAKIIKIEKDKEHPERQNIILDTNEIMSGPESKPYVFAKITSLYLEDSILHYTQEIVPDYYDDRINTYTFSKTEESRHGNVIMHPEVIDKIQGKWKSGEYWSFEVNGNTLKMDSCESKIVAYTHRSDPDKIVLDNEDAGTQGRICAFIQWKYKEDTIEAVMEVMDADSPTYVFKRE